MTLIKMLDFKSKNQINKGNNILFLFLEHNINVQDFKRFYYIRFFKFLLHVTKEQT